MAVFRLNAKRLARGFAAAVLMCLILLEALSFVIGAKRHSAFSNGDLGASIATGEYCDAQLDNGGRLPAHSSHQRNCALCIVCDRDQTFDAAVALLASAFIVLAPRPHDAPAWFEARDLAPSPLGWTSSWSSRAPPHVL